MKLSHLVTRFRETMVSCILFHICCFSIIGNIVKYDEMIEIRFISLVYRILLID